MCNMLNEIANANYNLFDSSAPIDTYFGWFWVDLVGKLANFWSSLGLVQGEGKSGTAAQNACLFSCSTTHHSVLLVGCRGIHTHVCFAQCEVVVSLGALFGVFGF